MNLGRSIGIDYLVDGITFRGSPGKELRGYLRSKSF